MSVEDCGVVCLDMDNICNPDNGGGEETILTEYANKPAFDTPADVKRTASAASKASKRSMRSGKSAGSGKSGKSAQLAGAEPTADEARQEEEAGPGSQEQPPADISMGERSPSNVSGVSHSSVKSGGSNKPSQPLEDLMEHGVADAVEDAVEDTAKDTPLDEPTTFAADAKSGVQTATPLELRTESIGSAKSGSSKKSANSTSSKRSASPTVSGTVQSRAIVAAAPEDEETGAVPPSLSDQAEMVSIKSQKSAAAESTTQASVATALSALLVQALSNVDQSKAAGQEQRSDQETVESLSDEGSTDKGVGRAKVPAEGASLPPAGSMGYGRGDESRRGGKRKKLALAALLALLGLMGLAIGLGVSMNKSSQTDQLNREGAPCLERRNLLAERTRGTATDDTASSSPGRIGADELSTAELTRRRLIREALATVAEGKLDSVENTVGSGKPGMVRRRRMQGKSKKEDVDCLAEGAKAGKTGKTAKSGGIEPTLNAEAASLSMSMSMSMSMGAADITTTTVQTKPPINTTGATTTQATATNASMKPDDASRDDPGATVIDTQEPSPKPTEEPTTKPPTKEPTDRPTIAPSEDQSTECGPITCPGGTSCVFIPLPFEMYDCLEV